MKTKPAMIALIAAVCLLLGCYGSGTRVMLRRRADSEIDSRRYPGLALLDLEYQGELELGELTARQLRESLDEIGDFEVLSTDRLERVLEEFDDFDSLDIAQLRRLGELAEVELVVTGEVSFSRFGSQDLSLIHI